MMVVRESGFEHEEQYPATRWVVLFLIGEYFLVSPPHITLFTIAGLHMG